MNLALRPTPSVAGLTRTEVLNGMAEAEPHWRALEKAGALMTPYQRFDFLNNWHRHIGKPHGIEPFIVVGLDGSGAPLFLWPIGRRRITGLSIAEFLGGKHVNFNLAIWRRDFAVIVTAVILRDILSALAGKTDALVLRNQPQSWHDTANPFALLPHQPSPSKGHSGALQSDFDALLQARASADTRRKIRKKEQRLAAAGTVRFARADTPAATRRVLDAFFAQKSGRMKLLGLPDVFGNPQVQRFIEALVLEPGADGQPAAELYSLSVDDTIVATKGGLSDGGRFCGMFNSMIADRFAAESPGEQIVVHLVRDLCARGFTRFDLGTGEARYKNLFCDDAEPLFDSFIPLTAAGHLFVAADRLGGSVKRFVKQTPAAWSLVAAARRLRARLA